VGTKNVAMPHRLVLVVLAVIAACGRAASEDPPCAAVATHLFALAQEELGKTTVDPATRRAVSDQLPAIRDALTLACTEGGWAAAVRRCMVTARTHGAFAACQAALTDEQRRALDETSRGQTSSR
jgi:hypothetical protein